MTREETPRCPRDQNVVGGPCECSLEMLDHGASEERRTVKQTIDESTAEKEIHGAVAGCRCLCNVKCGNERDNWIASYVRTRLRTMADDTFAMSRCTAEFAARAVQDRFLSDTDAVLKRILELAALRYLRDGSSTVTKEDVEVAIRSLAFPHQGQVFR
ncbi:hypothetical protein [Paraburkholderia sacchari]|uniref:hypothetical protein n=1 Tax=Paraburkholderia sacchari TaxID=159450 RepID=UPI0039A7615C